MNKDLKKYRKLYVISVIITEVLYASVMFLAGFILNYIIHNDIHSLILTIIWFLISLILFIAIPIKNNIQKKYNELKPKIVYVEKSEENKDE